MPFKLRWPDLRMPWTREADTITDTAAAVVCVCLREYRPNRYRRAIIFTAPDGTRVSIALSMVPTVLANTDEMEIRALLTRSLRSNIDDLWDIKFVMFVPNLNYERQLERFKRALLRFVADQGHLEKISFTYERNLSRMVVIGHGKMGTT